MATASKQQIMDLFKKARRAQEKGQLDDATRGYKRLIKIAPNLAEVHFNLAEVYALRGNMANAAPCFEAALKLRPNEPAIWVSYLKMASTHPNPKNFNILRERSKPVIGKSAAFSFFEGLAALQSENWQRAISLFRAALDGGFKQTRVYLEYATALTEMREFDLALEQIEQASIIAPNSDMVLFRKAGLLQTMGRIEEARVAITRAIDLAPNAGGHYAMYSSLTKMTSDDPFIPKMKSALKSKRSGDHDLPSLAYALAKAMEDTGQFNKVFGYLDQANHAVSAAYPYDIPAVKEIAAKICQLFERFQKIEGPVSDASPIFVTGAPRSGTTLIEQILASHSQVEGGGEIGIIQPKIVEQITSDKNDWDAEGNELLSKCVGIVEEFANDLSEMFPNAEYVTDKSISSYAILGFLAKLMPKARFIVVRRDPRDNALSIYKNQFRGGLHRYSNRLDHIAFFLRQFEEMVEFWRNQCPNSFYEIKYEDLIADPEGQSRALVAAAGLDWEEACLSFYETKRDVHTLSATQVRQPMYSSSVGAWKKFEQDMQPFLSAYGERD